MGATLTVNTAVFLALHPAGLDRHCLQQTCSQHWHSSGCTMFAFGDNQTRPTCMYTVTHDMRAPDVPEKLPGVLVTPLDAVQSVSWRYRLIGMLCRDTEQVLTTSKPLQQKHYTGSESYTAC